MYVLIVDDEAPVRQMMSFWLQRAGFDLAEAGDVESARLSIAQRRPDLILLDWILPGASGLDLARMLRRTQPTLTIPIIMVTGRIDESDKVAALDCGVDDYVSKPFAPRVLLARIGAVLRRVGRSPALAALDSTGIVLDPAHQTVTAASGKAQLAPTDFRLLEFLISHPERVHTRAQLLDSVWAGTGAADERTVDVQVKRLRNALEALQLDRRIQTVRGVGYRFSAARTD